MNEGLADEFMRHVNAALTGAVGDVAAEIADEVRESLRTPGPAPSRPGEPPHKQRGDLAASIAHRVEQDGTDRVAGVVYSTSSIADYLEFGTDRMAARPFLAPALDRAAPTLAERVGRAMASRL